MNQVKLAGITIPVEMSQPIYAGSNFTWGEALRNGERLPVATQFEGMEITEAAIVSNIVQLAHKLDRVRADFGNRPVRITSWLRPPLINKAVGGVPNSQHIIGLAADILIDGIEPHDVASKLAPNWAGGLGDSIAFTHLDLRDLMGHASARWDYGFA